MKRHIFAILFIFLISNAFGQEAYNFLNLQWRAGEVEIKEAHVGEEVNIKFDTINIPDNEIINIEIWEQTDGRLMDFIAKLQGTVSNASVELVWIVEFDIDDDNTNYAREIKEKRYTYIDYVFTVKYGDITVSGKSLSIMTWIMQLVRNSATGEPLRNTRFFLIAPDNEIIEGYTNDEGYIVFDRLRMIGQYRLAI